MKKQALLSIAAACIIALAVASSGCSKDSPVSTSGGSSNVNMNISFSKSLASGLGKVYGSGVSDSLRIDSAVVVLARIKFESHIDTVSLMPPVGDMPDGPGGMMGNDPDSNYSFKGPFVIHVRDTIGINFANANLPAGTYDGIKFRIHNLLRGELREDSDMRNHRPWFMPEDSIAGSSVTVWGAIMKNGVWTPFKYDFNGEVEFKVKGTFVVPEAGASVDIALNFNIGSFFIDTRTGALLDPTNMSMQNRIAIRQAVYAAFGAGRCGRDRGDGRPRL